MSETPAPEPAADAKSAEPRSKTPKVVLALLVVNLAATGFGVFTLMTRHAEAAKEVIVEKPKTLEITGPIAALDPFVVNLDEPGSSRYLKVTLELELENPAAEEIIVKSKQVLRDTILSTLSGLHLKDTLGATAKDTLRAALLAKVEAVVGTGKVRRMFFQEFVVQ